MNGRAPSPTRPGEGHLTLSELQFYAQVMLLSPDIWDITTTQISLNWFFCMIRRQWKVKVHVNVWLAKALSDSQGVPPSTLIHHGKTEVSKHTCILAVT